MKPLGLPAIDSNVWYSQPRLLPGDNYRLRLEVGWRRDAPEMMLVTNIHEMPGRSLVYAHIKWAPPGEHQHDLIEEWAAERIEAYRLFVAEPFGGTGQDYSDLLSLQ